MHEIFKQEDSKTELKEKVSVPGVKVQVNIGSQLLTFWQPE